ncbi:MAG: heavy metal transport/detoxification protein [Candidatus Amulumruptor caecigallinarius]|nr:heavy metal transport/detoxification protein [Candidatus Amulumruptor caecigallinarius]
MLRFKTNAKCAGCKAAIINAVSNKFPNAELSMDLENVDKVLEVHGIPANSETASQIVKTIEETGFRGSWLRD